ncbi:hypothetical protein BC940DRAFT_333177 [Gongronella butleri]|nr:hypothetical protein BC940DRAFT_333177 [Gongronella butleri]
MVRAAVQLRGGGGAAIVNNVIYYYGGYTKINVTSGQTGGDVNDLLTLDLSRLDYSNLTYNWQQVTPTPSALTYGGETLNVVSFNSNSQVIVNGWWTITNNLVEIFNPTIGTPAVNNWQPLSFPNNASYQLATSGGIVDIPSLHSLWFFGGFNAQGSETFTSMPYVYLYDYIQNQFSFVNSRTPNNLTIDGFAPVLSDDGQKIYLFCGGMEQPAANTNARVPYVTNLCELVWIYDVFTTSWTYINASTTSARVPTARVFHTATLIPGTSTVFIYGGQQAFQYSPQVVNDAAYTFNMKNNSFNYVTLGNSNNRPSTLAGHQAVYNEAQGKKLIFILFGRDTGTSLSQFTASAIDVTDLNQLAWVNTNASSGNGAGSHLSTGAIAGIAVGAAIAGIGATAALIFLFWRRRRQRQQFQLETTDPRHTEPLFFSTDMEQADTLGTSQEDTAASHHLKTPIMYAKPSVDEHETGKPYDHFAS